MNLETKRESLSEIIFEERPCEVKMCRRKRKARSSAVILSLQGTKYVNLVSLSTTTQIESKLGFVIGSLEGGNLTIKSIVTSCQGFEGGVIG